jgi:hypothetical protein
MITLLIRIGYRRPDFGQTHRYSIFSPASKLIPAHSKSPLEKKVRVRPRAFTGRERATERASRGTVTSTVQFTHGYSTGTVPVQVAGAGEAEGPGQSVFSVQIIVIIEWKILEHRTVAKKNNALKNGAASLLLLLLLLRLGGVLPGVGEVLGALCGPRGAEG